MPASPVRIRISAGLIGKIETWGCGYTNLNWMQASPCRSANLPQIRLEPIMKARAEALSPATFASTTN